MVQRTGRDWNARGCDAARCVDRRERLRHRRAVRHPRPSGRVVVAGNRRCIDRAPFAMQAFQRVVRHGLEDIMVAGRSGQLREVERLRQVEAGQMIADGKTEIVAADSAVIRTRQGECDEYVLPELKRSPQSVVLRLRSFPQRYS